MAGIDARAVAATQCDGLIELGVGHPRVRHREAVSESGFGEPLDQCDIVPHPVGSRDAQRLGAYVMRLPGGP